LHGEKEKGARENKLNNNRKLIATAMPSGGTLHGLTKKSKKKKKGNMNLKPDRLKS